MKLSNRKITSRRAVCFGLRVTSIVNRCRPVFSDASRNRADPAVLWHHEVVRLQSCHGVTILVAIDTSTCTKSIPVRYVSCGALAS